MPKFQIGLFLGVMLALTACSKSLDKASIEAQIKTELSQKGNLAIGSVTCPEDLRSQIGQTFECVGALEPDGGFFVEVEQEDELGTVSWEVPNSWRLLNLLTLEAEFQKVLQTSKGIRPNVVQVDCGELYRPTKPGDSFECQLKGRLQQPETILVRVESGGNVTWRTVKQVWVMPKAKANSTASAASAQSSAGLSIQPTVAESPIQTGAEDASGWVPLAD